MLTQMLLFLILSILIVLGIIELAELFIKWSYIPISNFNREKIFIIPLSGHHENIEYIVRSIIFTHTTQLSNCKFRIICIDLGLDSETKTICNILSRDFNCIDIISSKSKNLH